MNTNPTQSDEDVIQARLNRMVRSRREMMEEAGIPPEKPWHMTSQPMLSFWDRLRLLFGGKLFVRFHSPYGNCSAACNHSAGVYNDWPVNDGSELNGWPR